jgi:L-alanine-DL-glutamate epimerase-like enolase superfamily enzyme
MSGWDAEGWPLVPSLSGLPEARFAFESALCDLVARRRGVSASAFLGGRSLVQLPRNAVVSTIEEAHDAIQRGITTLKIKVGLGAASDQESQKEADKELLFLKQLRDELGSAVTLRLDANGVYDAERARKRLADFARYDVALIEQPTASAELASLGVCAIPWAVDESLSDPATDPATDPCDRFLSAPGCRAWVVKPALHGLRLARGLALRAIEHGLGVIVTHLIDGPVALAAACELALSLPVSPLACGLDAHAGLAAWPDVDIPQHRQAQHLITPSGGIGLGFARQGVPWS